MDDPIFDPWCLSDADRRVGSEAESLDDLLPPADPAARPEVETRVPSAPTGAAAPRLSPSRDREALRSLLLDRIERVSQRLVVAGHRTTLDDRLHEEAPLLRFRIEPRTGPLDGPDPVGGPVLELAPEGYRARRLNVRLWLDPLARWPTRQEAADTDRVDERWVDELLLDFVEQALDPTP